jgi:SAM-dependent methyltransferase
MSATAPEYKNPEFDEFALDYDAALAKGIAVSGESKDYFAEGRVKWLRKSLQRINFLASHILDFGCGTGSATPYLVTLPGFQTLLGLEVSPKSIQVAEKIHGATNIEFKLSSEYAPSGLISLAFCNGVFHHIPPADRLQAIKFIYDSLQPGGFFSLWENNPWNPGTRLVMSRIPFDRDAITLSFLETKDLLRAAGFEIHSIDFCFYFPRPLKWLRPLEPLASKIPFGAQYQVLARKPGSGAA